ncbi:DUF7528 family protein [Haloarchaeobius sp. DFWS5]|uniref:DUF7528 family protein n=1 Tax=Haloarchaeobius sp. DFWS5 TaxID=3446114 RepID=UPI003EBB0584
MRCLHTRTRIEEVTATWLVEKFPDHDSCAVVADSRGLLLAVGDETYELTRSEAAALREELSDALTQTHEFVHTTCTHRDDGGYVVERRGANSAGHRKVFDTETQCERLFNRLPEEFTAEDVGRTGLTGGRRHMLVWHFAEHPNYDCELVSRQPLTVRKVAPSGDTGEATETAETAEAESGADDGETTGTNPEVMPAD